MGGTNPKLITAVETYLDDLRRIRTSGGATGERSSYGPLANLLNAVGATLKPKVFCVGELAQWPALTGQDSYLLGRIDGLPSCLSVYMASSITKLRLAQSKLG